MKIKSIAIMSEEEQVGLFLSGSVAERNVLYTCADLEQQEKTQYQRFSVYDNHEDAESRDIEEGFGFPLQRYLDAAGVAAVNEIRLGSVDGFESVVTELQSKRYFFPGLLERSAEGKEPREAFISFQKNSIPVKYYPHPTIMFGQQGIDDKNKDYFAKGIRMLVAGSAEQGFWVRGTGLRCNRYFSLSRFFEWDSKHAGTMHWAELQMEDESIRRVPAISLSREFWSEQAEYAPEAMDQLIAVDANGQEISRITGDIWLFLADEALKQIGYFDGQNICTEFSGVIAGELREQKVEKQIHVPGTRADESEFYIQIVKQEQTAACYYYSLQELLNAFGDLESCETYEYYNHNMNHGQGGQHRVTAKGWSLLTLLELLPEIPQREDLENGSVRFQIFTNDNYKEKIALEANELSAYRFLLTYEQDQRSQDGMEKGDTSSWADKDLHFAPIKGTTPFRIYCGKESANPSVYKNAAGMVVTILF